MTEGTKLITTEQRQIAPWGDVIKSFLDTRKSTATQDTYKPTIQELATRWDGGPAMVSAADLADWRRGLIRQMEAGELAPGTVKRKLMAARSFFHFAHIIGQSNIDKDLRTFVLAAPRADVQRPFQILSEAEQVALLDAVNGQNRQVIATMLYAGLRVSETRGLLAKGYYEDADNRRWLQVRGKGNKIRQVPVGATLANILGEPKACDGPLFPSRQRSRDGSRYYSRSRLFQIVQAALKKAGISRQISPHSLRHTAAMRWIEDGVPLPVIQKWLGHESLDTTKKYLDHYESNKTHRYMK